MNSRVEESKTFSKFASLLVILCEDCKSDELEC
jgi:hypothetical protein